MKNINNIYIVLLALILVILMPTISFANNIESIDIQAEIQPDGSVNITDHRIFTAESGTEHYLSIGKLDDSEIINYRVFENGQELNNIGQWDTNASFEEKSGNYGMNYTGDNIELCFGLGSYGRKEFTIKYTITNFVFELTDANQAIYWQFINSDMDPIDKISISVTNSQGFKYEYPDSRIWGFGFDGQTQVNEDSLSMSVNEGFERNHYMVMLAILPPDTFSVNTSKNWSSNQIIDAAMEGANLNGLTYEDYKDGKLGKEDYYGYEGSNTRVPLVQRSSFVVTMILVTFLPTMLFFIFGFRSSKRGKEDLQKRLGPTDAEGYYREVPYQGEFVDVTILTRAKVSNTISAFILKWVENGMLVDEVEIAGIFNNKEKLSLRINYDMVDDFDTDIERRLWDMVIIASGDDGILSEKEFNKYIKNNITTFNLWTADIEKYSKDKLEGLGLLIEKETKRLKIFSVKLHEVTSSGRELVNNIFKFKNYLKDFSLLDERPVSNVKLWNEYLIWASVLGISKEVYEQLKIVDPHIEEHLPYNYNTILLTSSFAQAAQSTQSSANSSSSSFSGGGGSSFGGGGGSSFGGGSGGGTR